MPDYTKQIKSMEVALARKEELEKKKAKEKSSIKKALLTFSINRILRNATSKGLKNLKRAQKDQLSKKQLKEFIKEEYKKTGRKLNKKTGRIKYKQMKKRQYDKEDKKGKIDL